MAREIATLDDAFHEWKDGNPPVVATVAHDEFSASVIPGSPLGDGRGGEDGAVLYWTDGVVNEWAEWYEAMPTAVARLAALVACADGEHFFKDGPDGFTRWSNNFFNQTVTDNPMPNFG